MDSNYEDDYHKTLHGHLYQSKEYYELRAKLAYLNYFKGLKDIKDRKILEFGCGLGQNLYWLSKIGVNVEGYDISEFALNFCRKKGLKVTSKFSKLGKFDVIFSRHVFEHLKNPFEILSKLKDRLNKKGILIIVLPYERHERADFAPDIHRHLYCWNFRTINNLLDEAGYRVVKNELLPFAMGYKKLAFTSRINMKLYDSLTKFIGRMRGARELMVIAGVK